MYLSPFIPLKALIFVASAIVCQIGPHSLSAANDTSAKNASGKSPNVVVILSDDQGYGQIGCYADLYTTDTIHPLTYKEQQRWGYDIDKAIEAARTCTPNIDALREEGMRFTQAIAAPSCVPSRVGFITGQYPQRNRIYSNGDIYADGLPDQAFSLVKLFAEKDYYTGLIGKWHLGLGRRNTLGPVEPAEGKHPLDQGFHYFFGFERAQIVDYNSKHLFRNRESAVAEGFYVDQATDEVLQFLEVAANNKKPFFLFFSANKPHNPNELPPEKYQRYNLFDKDTPRAVLRKGQWINNFYNNLYAMDQGIGKVLNYLEQEGLAENTIVIFASDNGASWNFPVPGNGTLRGYKRQFYEGGIRVPLLIRYPGVTAPNSQYDKLVNLMDLLPTCLTAAGIEIPESLELDGQSILPALQGEEMKDRIFFWAGPLGTDTTAQHRKMGKKAKGLGISKWSLNPPGWYAYQEDWKLVKRGWDQSISLYNLESDVSESIDLSKEHPEIANKLLRKYEEWSEMLPKPILWDEKKYDGLMLSPEERERLSWSVRSMGR